MAGFTVGPWQAVRDEVREEFYITSGREIAIPIAAVEIGFDHPLEDEQFANARLIAAAPSLLLALEALLQWFRPSEDTDDADDQAVAAARQAHAAVKLARGDG